MIRIAFGEGSEILLRVVQGAINPRVAAAWRWVPPLAYLVLIHMVSSQPGNNSSLQMEWNLNSMAHVPGTLNTLWAPLQGNMDTLAHFFEFSLLAILLWWPLRNSARHWSEFRAAKWIFGFVVLNSIIDEFHQAFVPGRNASWEDAMADILGGAAALGWLLHRKKWRTSKEVWPVA